MIGFFSLKSSSSSFAELDTPYILCEDIYMNLLTPFIFDNFAISIVAFKFISNVKDLLNSPNGSFDKPARWITQSIFDRSSDSMSLISFFIWTARPDKSFPNILFS